MQAWNEFVASLDWGKETLEEWVLSLKVLRFDAQNLYLEAKDSFHVHWFEEHIRPKIAQGLMNNNGRKIAIHLSVPGQSEPAPKKGPPILDLSIVSSPLDPEMTFASFLVTPENKVAREILLEAEFNPIFLYGPKSAGKSHLLHSKAQHLAGLGKKVFFVHASTFTEHVVQAIRQGRMQEFRKVYREIDALFIDDIHIFSRKSATQEEFFHTFNTLHMAGKEIVLTANCPPSQLVDIEPRLISRFEWGISLHIKKLDSTLLLKEKARLWNFPLIEEWAQFFLEKFPRDPLLALQALILRKPKGEQLTVARATSLLKDLLDEEAKQAITPEKVIKRIAEHYSIKAEDLLGKSQTKEFTLPRQVAMFFCRERLKLPFQRIGELFGRDHSTVMTSVKRVQKGLDEKEGEILDALNALKEG